MIQIEENKSTLSAMSQMMKNEISATDWPKEGNIIDAKFIKKLSHKAYFDIGRFGTGIIYGVELDNAKETIRSLKPGDSIKLKIVTIDGEEGLVELSMSEAGRQKVWQDAKELMESGEIVKAKINGSNVGGLMATIGDIKTFIPVSQLSLEHYPKVQDGDKVKISEELKKFVDKELNVKIIDVNQRTNKIIASEREALSVNVKELISSYSLGDIVDCMVSGVADFGVFVRFVDNPEVEGMIHISELDHTIVENPKELVKINDEIKAKIIDIKDGKIFLSLKALKEDPWEKVSEKFKEGQVVEGKIYKLNPFGAIVILENNFQGMIHISEFDGDQAKMEKEMMVGKSYSFIIDSIKTDERRINLKLKK
jgi:small subunit ribosomal protein S1